ncbi:MAG: hypothetical protein EBZ77_04300 [Chitinophagia bacterium]|nr:hypothetical protein [Chitinophagia bacterium]
MKKIVVLLLAILGMLASCKKKNDSPAPQPASYGQLQVKFVNQVDGQPITFGTIKYTNAKGNNYSVELLKYYISNFSLVTTAGDTFKHKNIKLINAADSSTCLFTIDSVPNGNYSKAFYYLGVDPDSNHTGLQTGDLDPINAMIWSWNTGYTFFKHEGKFINDSGKTDVLVYHYGTDEARTTINVPLTGVTINGNKRTLTIVFNLNAVYKAPVAIEFNGNNNRQSTELDDRVWIGWLRGNFLNSFSFGTIE